MPVRMVCSRLDLPSVDNTSHRLEHNDSLPNQEDTVFDCGYAGKGIIVGVFLAALLVFPVKGNGEESTATISEKNSEGQQSTDEDSGLTMSDVMTWVQRFGNRVGENISEATSKTASAIKNATSDTKQESSSEDSP
jgi:gas vesicle protein